MAIDFGTSRSGYAFSFHAHPERIIHGKFDCERMSSLFFQSLEYVFLSSCSAEHVRKTYSCIILNAQQDGSYLFLSFGSDANRKLMCDLTNSSETYKVGFKYFKMNLFKENATMEAQNGKPVPIEELITCTLKV